MVNLPKRVLIEDVTLRDGLQGEKRRFTLKEKLWIAHRLIESGVKRIQIGSFVHPGKIPQMADTSEFLRHLPEAANVTYTALVLNETGLDQAIQVGVSSLYMGISATNTHNLENSHCTLAEARTRIGKMITRAKANAITVRAGIMMAFGCAFEGKVPPERIVDIARQYKQLGVDIIDLADTAGRANPRQVFELVTRVLSETGETPVSLHLHDAWGMGLANLVSGLQAGVTHFDTSVGGLGGCPFIPKAAGNIPTEDAVYMLNEMEIETGIEPQTLCEIMRRLEQLLDRALPGRICHNIT